LFNLEAFNLVNAYQTNCKTAVESLPPLYPITQGLLSGLSKGYHVHADWSGIYFLTLAILTGKKFHEKKFSLDELSDLRKFIEKEKPKGVVLSYVVSDKDCPIYDINFSPIIDLFDIPEMDYFKLLFVSKMKITKEPEGSWPEGAVGLDSEKIAMPDYSKGKVEFVMAYTR